MSILYLFIDGIGFGSCDSSINPFSRYAQSYLKPLGYHDPEIPEGWRYKKIDAHLGIDGLPQSATGQTSIWTGVNGSQAMGHHKTGYPGPTLINIIQEYSIIKKFKEAGYQASLINAYSDAYNQRISRSPRLKSASTHVQLASGQDLKSMDDLKKGQALYMDITHEIMHRLFPNMQAEFPVIPAIQRGRDLIKMTHAYELLIFEFFLSDKAGHKFDWELAKWVIATLEDFIHGIVSNLDTSNDLLIITSDHGNLEDLSTKSHTHNPVPLFVYGKDADLFYNDVNKISDIPKLIYDKFGIAHKL